MKKREEARMRGRGFLQIQCSTWISSKGSERLVNLTTLPSSASSCTMKSLYLRERDRGRGSLYH